MIASTSPETFGVSLDYRAFADRDDTNLAGIADREILEKLQALDQLPNTDRAIVKSVLDTYITKHRTSNNSPATANPPSEHPYQ